MYILVLYHTEGTYVGHVHVYIEKTVCTYVIPCINRMYMYMYMYWEYRNANGRHVIKEDIKHCIMHEI